MLVEGFKMANTPRHVMSPRRVKFKETGNKQEVIRGSTIKRKQRRHIDKPLSFAGVLSSPRAPQMSEYVSRRAVDKLWTQTSAVGPMHRKEIIAQIQRE